MRTRTLIMALIVAAMMIGVAGPASADITASQLDDAGWTCFPAGPDNNIHCLPPSEGNGAATSASVFTPDGSTFLGTETLRFTSKDLSTLPCPKDGGHWHEVGPDTWACHHWKGAPSS